MATGPLIVLVGQTASGKSEMAIKLAKKYNGEIICADSRTVYKYMDIGTAKPSHEDRKKIPHYLLDEITPDEKFTAAQMKELAVKYIEDVHSRHKVPFLVGGTGLYIDSVIYDFKFGTVNEKLRKELENFTLEDLQSKAEQIGISRDDINFLNKRHLIRAVERGGAKKQDKKLPDNCLILGIDIDGDKLKQRIKDRVDRMIQDGLEDEVRDIADRYGFDSPGMNAICYKEWQPYFENEQSFEQVKQKLYKNTWQYAKRQKTWFSKDVNIHWVTSVEQASVLAQQFLIQ